MDKSGANSYVYAKASGMLTKSFVGRRASRLFSVRTLPELWSLVFNTEVPAVPEILLAKRLEEEAAKKFIDEYKTLVCAYDKPEKILIDLLQYFDYENLKSLGAVAAMGKKTAPALHEITPFNILNYKAWPSIEKITQDTELSWYDKTPEIFDQQRLDTRLDIQYIKKVWGAAKELGGEAGNGVRALIARRYAMRNILWVLRLKVYYNMKGEEIARRLAFLEDGRGEKDVLAGDALKIIKKNVSHYEEWSSWKYSAFLNPHEEGSVWSVDPRWVEESFDKAFMRDVLKKFHVYPFTPMVLVTWFFIKLKELDYIRAATEALRLNIEAVPAMQNIGLEGGV